MFTQPCNLRRSPLRDLQRCRLVTRGFSPQRKRRGQKLLAQGLKERSRLLAILGVGCPTLGWTRRTRSWNWGLRSLASPFWREPGAVGHLGRAFYLLAGLALGNGGLAPLNFSRQFVQSGAKPAKPSRPRCTTRVHKPQFDALGYCRVRRRGRIMRPAF